MKLQKLIIENIASIEKACIDFEHGPLGESIQMFTALKLLGRETALVVVDGQDHHIKDYQKRIQWQNTIFAWFAKWLQDDPTWWNTLYPPKTL
jgi:hypothetical protein